eukprot:TRINITY_DN2098_c0_g1_i5.p1 TRINITY_DN2098_c0_g1~~TRINITY_DN2098_c0_g1_i5.p1  ORF type:complete len:244 (+),score=35.81 TRINITY_DN2098_c0_g1_i5:58-789(+)
MASRYVGRQYTAEPVSRGASVHPELSWSRDTSQTREVGSRYSSRAGSPSVQQYDDRPWSSASQYYSYTSAAATTNKLTDNRPSWTDQLIPVERNSEALLKSSRKLRERSFSPTREHVVIPRPVEKYKDNSDYYRGKVKSIYEREPMFDDFVRNLSLTDLNAFNSTDLSRMKRQFAAMVQDRWGRKQLEDPSVPHNTASMAHPWSNYLSRPEPASVVLADKHRFRSNTPAPNPRIYVYHRSTFE